MSSKPDLKEFLMFSGVRMQVEVTPERMEEIQKAFRNKKPIIWKGKKYLVQSGGEIIYHNDTKTWHTDLTLRLFEKKEKK